MPRPSQCSRVLPLAGFLLLGLLAVPAVWSAGEVPVGLAVQETGVPTPAPTPSPPDLDLAAGFAREGEVEAAIGAYRAVVEEGTVEERLAARLALGRLYVDSGEIPAAVRQLDVYLLEAPGGSDVRLAQFLLAEALSVRGDWAGAVPLYEAYVDAAGGATAYARMGEAEAMAHLGRTAEAGQEGESLLTEALPPSVRLAFILNMAQALEGQDPEGALVWYERLLSESEAAADQALALYRTALIKRELGDAQSWTADLLTVMERYPGTAIALQVAEEYSGLSVMMDEYLFALVYYHNGQEATARAMFEQVVQSQPPTPNSARSAYYLAVLDERAGDLEAAIAGYGRVLDLDASIELADDALWWQGRLLEQVGRVDEAEESYRRLVSEFAGSKWAAEARIREGLVYYDDGRFGGAAEVFAAIAEDSQGEERQRALLWQGKALAEAGDEEAAEVIWESLRQEAQADYYGLRAGVLLGRARGSLSDAGLDEEEQPDWAAIEGWLAEATGEHPLAALTRTLFDRHWAPGQELLALGLRREAGAEFAAMLEEAGGDAAALYQLARFLQPVGMADISSRAAVRLLRAVPEEAAARAPDDLWRLAYPAPFVGSLREAADEEEVPDILLLAMVRQESFFNPEAGSPAGAFGLTQVIGPTAEEIAADLAVDDFEFASLRRPSVSMRFGAHYLREQLDTFDGNLYPALAAYNGGPGSSLRWLEAARDDVDRFVEEIEFSETKLYVRLVSENLARYRQLYQGLEEPALPEE